MKLTAFYHQLYHMLEEPSPLAFDCGRLCGGACCRVDADLPGMYLFPGEEELFAKKEGFTITAAELPGGGCVQLLSCRGACNRADRPLSCRVFPLAPRLENGIIRARLDPRGRSICPLCNQPRSSLSAGFVTAVEAAFAELQAQPETAAFIAALARHVDEYGKPFLGGKQ